MDKQLALRSSFLGGLTILDKVGGFYFCTHNLPIRIMTDYLIKSLGCEIMIIGIQPKRIDFGSPPSKEVEKSVKHISAIIKEISIERRLR